jgi:hypothetical protein
LNFDKPGYALISVYLSLAMLLKIFIALPFFAFVLVSCQIYWTIVRLPVNLCQKSVEKKAGCPSLKKQPVPFFTM